MSFWATVLTAAVVSAIVAVGTVLVMEAYMTRRANETIGEHEDHRH